MGTDARLVAIGFRNSAASGSMTIEHDVQTAGATRLTVKVSPVDTMMVSISRLARMYGVLIAEPLRVCASPRNDDAETVSTTEATSHRNTADPVDP